MKSTIEAKDISCSPIEKDMTAIKSIFCRWRMQITMMNYLKDLHSCKRYPQDLVQLLLCLNVSLSKRLTKAHCLNKGDWCFKKIEKQFQTLMKATTADDAVIYLALESIVTCFSPVIHSRTVLEPSSAPKMNHLLPILEESNCTLRVLSFGIVISATQ